MFHKAIKLNFLEGTKLSVTFQDGTIRAYDMNILFQKYPQLRALEDRDFFLTGKLLGAYGIAWNDDLDIEVETIYEEGTLIGQMDTSTHTSSAEAVASARTKVGLSQKELSSLSGIDQSDISKIERGLANPSVSTLEKLAAALGGELSISIEIP